MKFFVGLAAGAALAAGAWYALKDPAMREAVEGVRGDLEARDYAALQARLDSGLAEVRRQVEERFGPQTDWSTEVVDGQATLVTDSDVAAEAAPSSRGGRGARGRGRGGARGRGSGPGAAPAAQAEA